MPKKYAEMSWSVEDIASLKPEWSEKRAEEFLYNNQNRLRDRLIELGWEVMDDLIWFEEDERDER